jgi:hypothetical protein
VVGWDEGGPLPASPARSPPPPPLPTGGAEWEGNTHGAAGSRSRDTSPPPITPVEVAEWQVATHAAAGGGRDGYSPQPQLATPMEDAEWEAITHAAAGSRGRAGGGDEFVEFVEDAFESSASSAHIPFRQLSFTGVGTTAMPDQGDTESETWM